jgi:hypothetical protein
LVLRFLFLVTVFCCFVLVGLLFVVFGFVWSDFVRAFWPFPRAFGSLLPEVLQEAVEKNRVMSSKDLVDLRAKWLKMGAQSQSSGSL